MNREMKEFEVTGQSGRRLAKRLDEIALALVLVMTGALWLAPRAMFPEGTWLAGAGLIVLGLNAVRRLRGLKASGFGVLLGLCALAAGIGHMVGQDLPLVPILLIGFGLGLVVRAALVKGRTAGMPDAS